MAAASNGTPDGLVDVLGKVRYLSRSRVPPVKLTQPRHHCRMFRTQITARKPPELLAQQARARRQQRLRLQMRRSCRMLHLLSKSPRWLPGTVQPSSKQRSYTGTAMTCRSGEAVMLFLSSAAPHGLAAAALGWHRANQPESNASLDA